MESRGVPTVMVCTDEFSQLVVGRSIETVERRAKYIVLKLSDNTYVTVHLRMTGELLFAAVERRLGGRSVLARQPSHADAEAICEYWAERMVRCSFARMN